MTLMLYNSLTRTKEVFVPLHPHVVHMYVCGITPYDYPHLGHGRSAINFDVLFRCLRYEFDKVEYVRNFTDIDDKLLARAEREGDINLFRDIAQRYIDAYTQDMHKLNCVTPTHEPRVTSYIPHIIDFIQQLLNTQKAYMIDEDVYFDLSSCASYGALSGRCCDDLLAGARVDVNERKRNPGDFVLWKGNVTGQFWKAPWGYGRPGWHIECSVMSRELLGDTIDIHGGGMDLLFPHHENEIAQSEGLTGKQFARYWLHNAFITINKEKMSKSLGNFITLQQMLEQYDPMIFRYFILQHHYRTPIDFSDGELQASAVAYKKLCTVFAPIIAQQPTHDAGGVIEALYQALADDLNTPRALGIIFEHLKDIKADALLAAHVKYIVVEILGLTCQPLVDADIVVTPEIQQLLDDRETARREKNWARADALRDQLHQLGYVVQDKKLS